MMVMPLMTTARAKLIGMIGRLWSGRTEPADADAYEAFLRDDLLPEVAQLAGPAARTSCAATRSTAPSNSSR